ncbi:dihydrofolate reductase family protein [Antrihabitans cavernicola]|uniref:Dihydrofolate reductase n=1 Tax=Antrihabitans cavernicola TaxID=2495913 RepID=A0A5A7SJE4_9NOCA|nr:dihydrofolate reductase family protein [Spelaeibacter cavernicola]KAA0024877.1 dihydrofolate reductase [Spelaeibacter cavernicola]
MRKLMLLDNATLDGHLARRSDVNAAVLFSVVDQQFDWQAELLADYDTMLFGRVSFQKGALFYPTHPSALASRMNSMSKVVFSNSLESLDWAPSRLATAAPADELARLRGKQGGNICIKGSPTLARTFSRQGLIDEYVFIVHPVIAGSDGVPHFDDPADLPALKLLDVTELAAGAVALTYARA